MPTPPLPSLFLSHFSAPLSFPGLVVAWDSWVVVFWWAKFPDSRFRGWREEREEVRGGRRLVFLCPSWWRMALTEPAWGGFTPAGTGCVENVHKGPVRSFGWNRLPNGTSMLHAGDGERCNPTLKHILNSANDPVITHEDIICKLWAAGRKWKSLSSSAATNRPSKPETTNSRLGVS